MDCKRQAAFVSVVFTQAICNCGSLMLCIAIQIYIQRFKRAELQIPLNPYVIYNIAFGLNKSNNFVK